MRAEQIRNAVRLDMNNGKKELHILFTSVGRRVELVEAFREAARRIGIRLVVHGSDISKTAPALFYCDIRHITCRISDAQYIPSLLSICKDNRIDLLIPTIDTDLLILAKTREQFEAIGTKVFISSPEMIGICRDKRYTADFFESCGLHSPHPVDDIKDYHGGFPCFIKPKDGSSSVNAFKVSTAEDLLTYTKDVPDYIIQPFVDGEEYTIDIFCSFGGEPIYITPRRRDLVRQGEVIKTKITQDDRMIEGAEKICAKFKPAGPITVQLIRDRKSGEDWYIEINPRFGGGSPLSMKAGADSAEASLRLLLGEDVPYQKKAARDAREYSRFDDSVCSAGNGVVEIHGLSEVQMHTDGMKVILFDLDDTLYNEIDYVRSGYNMVATAAAGLYGEADEQYLYNELLSYFRAGQPAISQLVAHHQTNPSLQRGDEKLLLDIYRTQNPSLHLSDEAAVLLQVLHAEGISIGIVTDGRPAGQKAKLKSLGLDTNPAVSEILITDELAGRVGSPETFRKPNSLAFVIMQQRFAVPFEEMAYVGDNPSKDFTAPRRLGMRCIYYRNPDGLYYDEKELA